MCEYLPLHRILKPLLSVFDVASSPFLIVIIIIIIIIAVIVREGNEFGWRHQCAPERINLRALVQSTQLTLS